MTGIARYVGRHGGDGVDDGLSGPDTIAALFGRGGLIIDDPASFPWALAEPEHWREPVLIDLTGCSDDDLLALAPVLPVLTPDDRVAVAGDHREELASALHLPDAALLEALPEEPAAVLAELERPKLRRALLREVLAPILTMELEEVAGHENPRPLRVIDVGATDGWRASLVPSPHSHRMVPDADAIAPESAEIVVIEASILDAGVLDAAIDALVPGGLIVFVLDDTVVTSATGMTMAGLVELLDRATRHHHVYEHVWGLHERPGAPTSGGVVAVRLLGGSGEPAES